MTQIPTLGSSGSFKELLDRWQLYAEAQSFSEGYIAHMRRCVGYFYNSLPPNTRVGDVTVVDYRRFISSLRVRIVWDGRKAQKDKRITGTTINTYARTVKAFFYLAQS